jgi:hypothetical protein
LLRRLHLEFRAESDLLRFRRIQSSTYRSAPFVNYFKLDTWHFVPLADCSTLFTLCPMLIADCSVINTYAPRWDLPAFPPNSTNEAAQVYRRESEIVSLSIYCFDPIFNEANESSSACRLDLKP